MLTQSGMTQAQQQAKQQAKQQKQLAKTAGLRDASPGASE